MGPVGGSSWPQPRSPRPACSRRQENRRCGSRWWAGAAGRASSLPRPGEHPASGKLAQKRAQRQYADWTVLKRYIAEVNAAATVDHACAMQLRESAAVLRAPAGTRFHFDSDRKRTAVPHEIDLRSGRCPIVREFASATRVRDLRAQLMKHQRLE